MRKLKRIIISLPQTGLLTLKGFRKKKSQIVDQFLRNATADKAMKPKLVFSHLKSRTEAVDDSVGERMPGRRSLLGLWQGGFRWERQNLFAAWTKVWFGELQLVFSFSTL